MKRIIRVISTVCLILVGVSTLAQDDCEKDISTNPDQPFNNHPFPSNKYNPWINSDFDIGELVGGSVPMMPLNNQISWQIPAPLGLLASLRENAPSSLSCNPEALNEIDHLNS